MTSPLEEGRRCRACQRPLAPSLLACPSCGALVHREALEELARRAEAAEASERLDEALTLWRDVLARLPAGSKQASAARARIDALASRAGSPAKPPGAARPKGASGWLVAAALGVWKLKWVAAFLFTKGKLALFGLTKVTTLLSMLATVGVYATLWGLPFALGLVLSIYIHEIGHVAALRRLGIRADAPMFIPGLGAFVRLRQRPKTPEEDAEVSLGGPLFGLSAALACAAIGWAAGSPLFLALARVGAWINLFNLLPIGPLDGGGAFRALDRKARIALCAIAGGLVLWGGDGLLLLIALVAGVRAFERRQGPAPRSRRVLAVFAVLLVALSLLAGIDPQAPSPDAAAAERAG